MLKKKIIEHNKVLENIIKLEPEINKSINLIYKILKKKGKILICGNGGSAADAQHLAAEFIVRLKSSFNRRALPIIPLALDTSTLTACGNDYGFENIFSRQIEGIANQGDLAVGISTSGNSENVLKGLEQAKINKCSTLSLTGNSGGKLKNVSDHSIIVDSSNTARIQECHILIGHILCLFIDKNLNI